jgi:hypothetical protein
MVRDGPLPASQEGGELMRILEVNLKEFRKDDGEFSWTPDVHCEYESDAPLLRDQQVKDIEAAFDQQRLIIMKAIESWGIAPIIRPTNVPCMICADGGKKTLCVMTKSKAGNDVLYCENCKDYRRRDGTAFPKGA